MTNQTPERIRAILEDLYALDPTLRAHAADLEKLVVTLLQSKPDVKIDATFVSSLRQSLLKQEPKKSWFAFLLPMTSSQKILFPVAAVAMAVLVLIIAKPELFSGKTPIAAPPQTALQVASHITIERQAPNAFGSLSNGSAVGLGGGGGVAATAAPMAAQSRTFAQTENVATGDAVASAPTAAPAPKMMSASRLVAPGQPSDYFYERSKYVYIGTLPDLDAQVSVYRRQKNTIDASSLAGVLQSLNIGSMDLKSFGKMDVQQLALSQPGDDGYQVFIDMNEGMVNINEKNYGGIKPYISSMPCRPGYCGDTRPPLTEKDVPANDVIVGIATDFLSKHGISLDGYGAPVVDDRWKPLPMMRAQRDFQAYVPEILTVIYPQKIDGMTVYDQSGFPFGLSVSVNIREKRVSSVWNFSPLRYQASAYAGVTDPKQILDIAARGGTYSAPFGQDPNERTKDVALGTPERVLMQAYHTREDGMGEEILVPALRFPITGENQEQYHDAIMVPLAKDVLDQPVIMYGKAESGVAMPGAVNGSSPAVEPPSVAPVPMMVK